MYSCVSYKNAGHIVCLHWIQREAISTVERPLKERLAACQEFYKEVNEMPKEVRVGDVSSEVSMASLVEVDPDELCQDEAADEAEMVGDQVECG